MQPQTAHVIDLSEYRRRRQPTVTPAPVQAMPAPVVWVPMMWVWVPWW